MPPKTNASRESTAATDDSELLVRQRLSYFTPFLLLHFAVRDWLRFIDQQEPLKLFLALGFTLCFLAAWKMRELQPVIWGAFALATIKAATIFPGFSNHFFLEWLCLMFLCIARIAHTGECEVAQKALRFLPVWALAFSGIQKIIYGTYFNGCYLAFKSAYSESFANFFEMILPARDIEAFRTAEHPGPYRFYTPVGIALSNAVWITEITAAAFIFTGRFQRAGIVLGALVVLGIELPAHEFMFGALMANLLGLYLPPVWSKYLMMGSAGFYAFLIVDKLFFGTLGFFN